MRLISSVIVVWFLLLAAGTAQQQGRHGSGANRGTTSTPPAEDSDTATFTREVAGEANG